MIIIDKKKILMLLIGVFCFSTLLLTNMNKVENTVLTSTVPVSSRIIVLDAGHGKPDERSCLLTLKITLIFYKK